MKFILSLILLIITIFTQRGVESNSPPSSNFPFSQAAAESYLRYAYVSYCDLASIVLWTCTTCAHEQFADFKIMAGVYNDTTDTQAYVGIEGLQIIVAFRGSMDIASWITNLQFLQIPYPQDPKARVHSGFYDSWSSVRDEVFNAINISIKHCPQCTNIMVVGHSLGAALATLAIAEIQGEYQLPAFMYNFGSPRVGDNAFASYFNSIQPNTQRVTFENDLVPHVPPEGMIQGYHHVPSEVFFSSNSTYKICNDSGEDPSCSDSVIGYSIYDHLNYFGMECCCR